MKKTLTYTVTEEENGLSVKTVLSRSLALSRHEISRLKFTSEGITLNGYPVRVTQRVESGDCLRLCFPEDKPEEYSNQKALPQFLYEDEDLAVVYKQSGLVSHPSKGHVNDDLGSILKAYYKGHFTIRAIGRLDRDVSGIMVYAKNQITAARLSREREEGSFHKEYLAVVQGRLPKKKDVLIFGLKASEHNGKRQYLEDGSNCETRYEVAAEFDSYSLVKVVIKTGKTHQIRAGFAGIGHPLLGDTLYGGSDDLINRCALHCTDVHLVHPFTGETLSFHSPLPKDMQKLIKKEMPQ